MKESELTKQLRADIRRLEVKNARNLRTIEGLRNRQQELVDECDETSRWYEKNSVPNF